MIEELSLLSKLDVAETYPIKFNHFSNKIQNESFLGDIDEKKVQSFQFENFDENNVQFQAHIQLFEDESKDITVKISNIKFLINAGFFITLSNFVLFDDSLNVSVPKKHIEKGKNIENTDKLLNLLLNINNVCLCIPITNSDECFVTRGRNIILKLFAIFFD